MGLGAKAAVRTCLATYSVRAISQKALCYVNKASPVSDRAPLPPWWMSAQSREVRDVLEVLVRAPGGARY